MKPSVVHDHWIIDDSLAIRESLLEYFRGQAQEFATSLPGIFTFNSPELDRYFPAESAARALLDIPLEQQPKIIILDLALGKSMVDGLDFWRQVQHRFTGLVIVHSNTYLTDKSIRDSAQFLGLHFAARKQHLSMLNDMVFLGLGRLACNKRNICVKAERLASGPLPAYEHPTDLATLLLRCQRIARSYDGRSESFDDTERLALKTELEAHFKAAHLYCMRRSLALPAQERDAYAPLVNLGYRELSLLINQLDRLPEDGQRAAMFLYQPDS